VLRDKNEGESFTIMNEERKVFELTKMYSQTGFPSNETCVGYPINVYQETIGKTFREYLVNFEYFTQMMENYGFVLVDKVAGLPNGTGLFGELFAAMEAETRIRKERIADYKNAHLMTADEKQISFMNRYFVFRKTHNVNAEKVSGIFMQAHVDDDAEQPQPTAKKTKRKVTIIGKVLEVK
jgi:hypothetical protein